MSHDIVVLLDYHPMATKSGNKAHTILVAFHLKLAPDKFM